MSHFEQLRGRVDQAVAKLSTATDTRRHQNQTLQRLLADLETKYQARTEELTYCTTRIEALSRENTRLTEMVEQLVGILEAYNTGTEEDPIYRASAMAGELLNTWSETNAASDTAAETPTENDTVVEHVPAHFEDVSEQELAIEDLLETTDELPTPVVAARAQVDGPEYAETSEVELAPTTVGGSAADQPDDGQPLQIEPTGVAAEHDVADTLGAAEPTEIALTSETPRPDAVGTRGDHEPAQVASIAPATEPDVTDDDFELIGRTIIDLDEQTVGDGAAEPDPESLAAELDIPDPDPDPETESFTVPDDEDTEASIRAMMARLERAAARAQELTSGANQASLQPPDEPEKVA